MKQENQILNQLKKTPKPEVPIDFFDSFSEDILSKIDDKKLDFLSKSEKPKVPDNFFETFPQKLKGEIEKPKKGKVITLRNTLFFTSIAASIALLVNLFVSNPIQINESSSDEIVEIETVSVEGDDLYLAYLNEHEIVDYIIENNIDVDEDTTTFNNEDDIFEEVEYLIEDYYLNQ
ncbi:MAG: hypothetical protein ACWA41_07425 [Putridiphycobacter sp.]